MKQLISAILLLVVLVSCKGQTDCKNFTLKAFDNAGDEHIWRIVYNQFHKRYAIAETNASGMITNVLAKDHYGDFGIYAPEGMDDTSCYDCIDPNKSWFSTSCQAKEFLLLYARKKKEDKWQ